MKKIFEYCVCISNIFEYQEIIISKMFNVLYDSPMMIIHFSCSILYHPLYLYTISKMFSFNTFFKNKFIAHYKYQRDLVTLLRIEILRQRVSNTLTSNDTKSNPCNSRVEVGGYRIFKAEK